MANIIVVICIIAGIVTVFRFQQKQKKEGKNCCGNCTACKGITDCLEDKSIIENQSENGNVSKKKEEKIHRKYRCEK